MGIRRHARCALLQYKREDSGNVTIFSIFMLVLILMITGASVDVMRFEATRTEMQSAMDRAVLAAADLDQKQAPDAVVHDYLHKLGLENFAATVQTDQTLNHRVVTASGSVDLDSFFLHMSGFDQLTAPALSSAEETISNVEISLVLDVSGSMRENSRMDKMRPAAQDFVRKVMAEETHGITTLNLVPFAGQVNPGDILFDYFRGERPTIPDEPDSGTEEEPVVEERGDHFEPWAQAISNIVFYFDIDGDDIYDRAHKIEGFPEGAPRDADDLVGGAVAFMMAEDDLLYDPDQFLGASIKGGTQNTRYFQVKGDQNGNQSDLGPTKNKGKVPGWTYSYGAVDFSYWDQFYTPPSSSDAGDTTTEEPQNVNMPSSCVEIYDAEFATTDMPLSDDYVPHFNYWPYDETVMDWGWCPGEDTAVQYYSADRASLVDFIADMRMHDGTGLQYGMKYGLALLDPNNRDEVSHLIQNGIVDARFEGRPIDWNDQETEKYVVLMTDGETTEQYRPTDPTNPMNGDVALSEQGLSSYYALTSQSASQENLQRQCDLAKSLGVTVFTIAFETGEAATNDMRACASSESHFFHVQGSEIANAFDTVARQINNLRLIQ